MKPVVFWAAEFLYSIFKALKKYSPLPGEKWAEMKFRNRQGKRKYAISNMGRVCSFKETLEDGKILSVKAPKHRLQKINIIFQDGKAGFTVHKLVAEHFLEQPSPRHTYVIHLDRDLHNNHASNLKFATYDEATQHFSGKDVTKSKKIKFHAREEWKLVKMPGLKKKYAVTNMGRLISFSKNIEDGSELTLNIHPQGYRIWRFRLEGVSTHYLIHRLVAEYFLKPPSKEHIYVIHKDHSKTNNYIDNLKWVTYEEQRAHSSQSEASLANARRLANRSRETGKGMKLTEAKVKMIKKLLNDPNRKTRLKMLAKQFKITTMQLYRIRTGENWGWVEV